MTSEREQLLEQINKEIDFIDSLWNGFTHSGVELKARIAALPYFSAPAESVAGRGVSGEEQEYVDGRGVGVPAEERPPRPPMLLAMDDSIGCWEWYTHSTYLDKTLWVRGCYSGLESKHLLAIDREASDPAAVALYDQETPRP